jgi:hypothetical protein
MIQTAVLHLLIFGKGGYNILKNLINNDVISIIGTLDAYP